MGKGAACDTALEIYEDAGLTGGVVAVGGSIGLYGSKPDGTPWRVAVRDPGRGIHRRFGGAEPGSLLCVHLRQL